MTPESYPALIGYYEGTLKGLISTIEMYRENENLDIEMIENKLKAILKGGQEYWNQIHASK